MQKKVLTCLLFFSLMIFLCGSIVFAADKASVSVSEFKDNSGGDAPAGAIADMLVGELSRTGSFTIVERRNLAEIAQEQRLSAQGLIDEDEVIEVGRLKAARYKITGSITEYYYIASGGFVPIKNIFIAGASVEGHVKIALRVSDSITGEIILTASREGVAKQSQGGLITKYGGFGTGKSGTLLAQAAFNCVKRLAEDIQNGLLRQTY